MVRYVLLGKASWISALILAQTTGGLDLSAEEIVVIGAAFTSTASAMFFAIRWTEHKAREFRKEIYALHEKVEASLRAELAAQKELSKSLARQNGLLRKELINAELQHNVPKRERHSSS